MSRHALLIGTTAYQDPLISQLTAPAPDVEELHAVLTAQEIGGFEARKPLVNEPSHLLNLELERFFQDRALDDLLLLYFSGHGMLDDHGKLYLLATNTDRRFLRATAIDATFLRELMDQCRAQKQILILDCCHSGAFGRHAKGGIGTSAGTDAFFGGNGRVVLTASNSTQFAFEGDKVIGDARTSLFTHFLLQGLRTGDADLNGNGYISVDELYLYAHTQVAQHTSAQTPGKFADRQEGDVIIARNAKPRARLDLLSEDILRGIESGVPAIRMGALQALGELLQDRHSGVALAARDKLRALTAHDSRMISETATRLLAAANVPVIVAAHYPTHDFSIRAVATTAAGTPATGDEPLAVSQGPAGAVAPATDDVATSTERLIDSNSAIVSDAPLQWKPTPTVAAKQIWLLGALTALSLGGMAVCYVSRGGETPEPETPEAPPEVNPEGALTEHAAPASNLREPGAAALAEAQSALAEGNSISAHFKLKGIPLYSPLWASPEVAQIEAAWADELFARAGTSPDKTTRIHLLEQIANTRNLDAQRRDRAATELAAIEATP